MSLHNISPWPLPDNQLVAASFMSESTNDEEYDSGDISCKMTELNPIGIRRWSDGFGTELVAEWRIAFLPFIEESILFLTPSTHTWQTNDNDKRIMMKGS
jgi:hypothetical protein